MMGTTSSGTLIVLFGTYVLYLRKLAVSTCGAQRTSDAMIEHLFGLCRRGDSAGQILGCSPVLPKSCPLFGHLVDRCEPSVVGHIGLLCSTPWYADVALRTPGRLGAGEDHPSAPRSGRRWAMVASRRNSQELWIGFPR